MNSNLLFSSAIFPLHPAQTELIQGLWAEPLTGPCQPIGGFLTLTGSLGFGVLRRVIDHLPVLFDVFRWQPNLTNSGPNVQINRHFQRPLLPVFDCSGESYPQRAADVWLQQRFTAPLDGKQSYFDLALLRVSNTEHRLLIRGHRLLLDDAGFDQIVRYIAAAYTLLLTGDELPEFGLAYAEDALTARLYPNSLAYSESANHWQVQFPVLPAQLLHSMTSEREKSGEYRTVGQRSFCRALTQAATACQESEECLLLTALTVYFARRAGLKTCVFGRVVSGRQTKRQRLMVGQFNRLLPIRCVYKPGQSVRLLIRTIKRQHQYDNSYRYHPMSHVVAGLGTGGPVKTHLFDVLLKVLPSAPELNMNGLNCRVERFAGVEADLPLQLLWQSASAYQAASLHVVGQSCAITERETGWMLSQVEQLLVKFAQWPDATVDSVDVLLPPPERLFTPVTSRISCQSVSQPLANGQGRYLRQPLTN